MVIDTKKTVTIGYIVAILILFIYRSYVYNTLIGGMWEADASFCMEAGLSYFYLMIGPGDILGNRSCYILSGQGAEVFINKPTTVNISLDWTSGLLNDLHFCAYFYDIDEIASVFPPTQYIKYYPECAKIILYYDDTITAVMYKNGSSSELVANQEADL